MRKKIIYIMLLSGFICSSCSENFLDQKPPLYVEPDDIYSTPERIESTLLGLYAAIKNTSSESFLGGKTYVVFDNRSEDLINSDENLVTLANTYNFKVTMTDQENNTTWNNAYAAINKVNTFLKNLEGAKDVVEDKFEQYKAEAKFVRALAYFYLNNLYSTPYIIDKNAKSVPLRLEAESDNKNNGKPRETVEGIYNQILSDLKDYEKLPVKSAVDETNVTRATQAAAKMLLMRVYMAMDNWTEAEKIGKTITGYNLTPNFSDLFKEPYYTDETIFSLPMNITNTPNTQQSVAEYYNASNVILKVDKTNGILSKTNYNNVNDERVQMVTADGKLLKFTDVRTKSEWIPIFRYAETLLNLAECYIHMNNEPVARNCLKEVRSRSLEAGDDALNVDNLTGDDLKQAIYNERRLEFIGEGMRGIDVLRRGDNFERSTPITPQDKGYVWPIPQSEQLLNPDLNK